MRDQSVSIINTIHRSAVFGKIIHSLNYCIQKEMHNCGTVLDLGCGPSSPLQYCSNVIHSVGVEAFGPYLEESQKKRIHNEYLHKSVQELDFKENSFDAVICIELLEHLSKEDGLELLRKAEHWGKKKLVVTTPNGFVAQKVVDNNPFQEHLSGWDHNRMKALGFNVRGLAGLKYLRQEVQGETMGDDLTASISLWPKTFWLGVAALSQLVTYYIPQLAFELICVKTLKK